MHYIKAFDRNQMVMTSWDSLVEPESTARLIDAFVNSLNLSDYGVKQMASEGRQLPFQHILFSMTLLKTISRLHRPEIQLALRQSAG